MRARISRVLPVWFCLLLPLQLSADIRIETATLALTFNDQGSLVQASACYPQCQDDSASRLQLERAEGIIGFEQTPGAVWVQRQGLPPGQGDDSLLHFTGSKGQSISWIIPAHGYLIEAATRNIDTLVLRAGAEFKARPAAGFGGWLEQMRYIAVGSSGVQQIGLDEKELRQVYTDWAGFRNRFWTVLASGDEESTFDLQTGADNSEALLRRSGGLKEEQHFFYLGPVEAEELSAVDEILGDMLYAGLWFWLRWICFGLYYLLGWIHQSVVADWGVAIMLLSFTVHILMLPLSRMADRVQNEVNATAARLAPELSRIRKEFRGEEQAARMTALYKSAKVHPLYSLKSMLGIAVVIPVFIGAFDMLAENIHLLNAGFLWISDLSRPDALAQLPLSLPFFGSDLNLMPVLMTGLSVLASWLHKPPALSAESRKQQVRNMLLLALAFFALFYTFPAGMVLYWTSNNLIAVAKSLWARRRMAATT